MSSVNTYSEAIRYIQNAKDILSQKAGKNGKFYSDAKYVRMACNTAYNGLLIALNALFESKGVEIPKNRQKSRHALSVEFYRSQLAKMNKSKLKEFNEIAYPYLHEYGGYDGNLSVHISQEGIETAKSIIDWANQQMK